MIIRVHTKMMKFQAHFMNARVCVDPKENYPAVSGTSINVFQPAARSKN